MKLRDVCPLFQQITHCYNPWLKSTLEKGSHHFLITVRTLRMKLLRKRNLFAKNRNSELGLLR